MTEPCAHVLTIESMGEPDEIGRRWAHMRCQLCDAQIDILTKQTDEQLAQELALSQAIAEKESGQ